MTERQKVPIDARSDEQGLNLSPRRCVVISDWQELLTVGAHSEEPALTGLELNALVNTVFSDQCYQLGTVYDGHLPAIAGKSPLEIVTAFDLIGLKPQDVKEIKPGESIFTHFKKVENEENIRGKSESLKNLKKQLALITDINLNKADNSSLSELVDRLSGDTNIYDTLISSSNLDRQIVICAKYLKDIVSRDSAPSRDEIEKISSLVKTVLTPAYSFDVIQAIESGEYKKAYQWLANNHPATLYFEGAFKKFLSTCSRNLNTFNINPDSYLAEEIVYSAFIKVFLKVDENPYITKVLFDRMMINSIRTHSLDWVSSAQVRRTTSLSAPSNSPIDILPGAEPGVSITEIEIRETLVSFLPPEQKDLVKAQFILGMTPSQIFNSDLREKWGWKTINEVYLLNRMARHAMKQCWAMAFGSPPDSDEPQRIRGAVAAYSVDAQSSVRLDYQVMTLYKRLSRASQKLLGAQILPPHLVPVGSISKSDFERNYTFRNELLLLTEEKKKNHGKRERIKEKLKWVNALNNLSYHILNRYHNKGDGDPISSIELIQQALERSTGVEIFLSTLSGLIISATDEDKAALLYELADAMELNTLIILPPGNELDSDESQFRVRQKLKNSLINKGITHISSTELYTRLGFTKRKSKVPNPIDPSFYDLVLVVDAEKINSKSGDQILRLFPHALRIGFSTALDSEATDRLGTLFPTLIHKTSISEAVRSGNLNPFITEVVKFDTDLTDVYSDSLGDFDSADLYKAVNKRERNLIAVDVANKFYDRKIAYKMRKFRSC